MEARIGEIRKVRKRDGRIVSYNHEKIVSAMGKAFLGTGTAVDPERLSRMADEVYEALTAKNEEVPGVEEIQDQVELILQENGDYKVAKAYILYRNHRSERRVMDSSLMKIYEKITFEDAKNADLKRENANVDGNTAMGTMLKYGSEGSKAFTELFVLPKDQSRAHRDGLIHIHDLDFYNFTTTCTQIDLIQLFKGGFSTGHGYLREPQDIMSYSALACIAIQSNQNDQHGGQSIPNFDYAMAQGVAKTYVRLFLTNLEKALALTAPEVNLPDLKTLHQDLAKNGFVLSMAGDKKYEEALERQLLTLGVTASVAQQALAFAQKEALRETDRNTFQAMEALIHNLNTMNSRAGAQVPFSSLNYGTDTSAEGRLVVKNLLLALEKGLGNHETPIFPIHIFRIKEGINYNPGEPNFDLFEQACAVSAKRLFPNFSFQDAPFNLKYYKPGHPETEISYMGCRTRVLSDVLNPGNESPYGRGNLSFTSVNLPRLAIQAEGNLDRFWSSLEETMDLVVRQLLDRFQIQKAKKVKNFPFLMGQGVWTGSQTLSPEDTLEEVLKHGTLSMGFIGLAETLTALLGVHHGEDPKAQELGLAIIRRMRQRMEEETAKHQLNFSLIATPAEGLAGRFVRLDRKQFGTLPGITDKEYYTNSFHVPVGYSLSAFKKIGLEAPYHELTNAGHITYVELDGDTSKNPKAFMKIIRHMKESGIGYGSVNHPVDQDPLCSYVGIIGDTCPQCGRTEEEHPFVRIRRITGYLVGNLDRFNNAKLSEVRDRVVHGERN